MPRPSLMRLGALSVVWLLHIAGSLRAQSPLHDRIVQLIAAGKPDFDRQAAPRASDAEFLRRIYLDLTGTIPTPDAARTFLRDSATDKRANLIDRLLASPEHSRHMATVFDVMLMERRPDKHVPHAQWLEYLRSSFAANKPWDQLVREIFSADGTDPKTRPAAKFILDREAEPNLLTRDVSRLFLGMNFQCCQCHDHPLVDDYKQEQYYGIYAFLNRSFLFTDKAKGVVLAEKAEGEVTFQSVFDPAKVTKTTGSRLPGGKTVMEVKFEKGKEYEVAPANGVRPVPKFSRRAQLAPLLAAADDVPFRRSAANRLWALVMGRGLVHPLDMDHSANPPSHPELLTLLADEFAARKFDIRAILRELVLSATYQRSSEMPPELKEASPSSYLVANLKPLSPEQLAWATMQATGLTDVERQALGKNANEATLYARLVGSVAPFVKTFGTQPGEPQQGFRATLEQALFVENGALIRGWLAPRAGNLADRLSRLKDASALTEELYLSVLTRLPCDEERKQVAAYLQERDKDRVAAIQELAWALLASAEFRFNH
jgi:hypothetical protein